MQDPHINARVVQAGAPLAEAESAMIMVHGRGASAESILELAHEIGNEDMAYLAPEAVGNTWYPYSFLESLDRNEPWLSSALACVDRAVKAVLNVGIPRERVVIAGFSQGGCLSLEYAVRNPARYGGVFGLSAGLIGPPGTRWLREGRFEGTPVFLGCSDIDFHIPVERVYASANIFREMGAEVTDRIYPGMGHTVNDDEIVRCHGIVAAL